MCFARAVRFLKVESRPDPRFGYKLLLEIRLERLFFGSSVVLEGSKAVHRADSQALKNGGTKQKIAATATAGA